MVPLLKWMRANCYKVKYSACFRLALVTVGLAPVCHSLASPPNTHRRHWGQDPCIDIITGYWWSMELYIQCRSDLWAEIKLVRATGRWENVKKTRGQPEIPTIFSMPGPARTWTYKLRLKTSFHDICCLIDQVSQLFNNLAKYYSGAVPLVTMAHNTHEAQSSSSLVDIKVENCMVLPFFSVCISRM